MSFKSIAYELGCWCSYGFLDASFLHQSFFTLLSSFVLLSDRGLIDDFKESAPPSPTYSYRSHSKIYIALGSYLNAAAMRDLKGVVDE
jgi:hypothetical protein